MKSSPRTLALLFAAASTLSAQTTINYADGTFNTPRSTTGNPLTLNADPGIAATEQGVISGTGSVTKTGTGTLLLTAVNTYTGGTILSAGTLLFNADNRLAPTGALTVNGGLFDLGLFNQTVGSLSGTGGRLWFGTLTVNQSTTTTFSGGMTNTTLVFNGTGGGALTLAGTDDNDFGRLVVNGGTVTLAKENSASAHAVGDNGLALTLNNGGTVTLAGTGDDQIYYNSDVIANTGATFDLNGRNEGFNTLTGAGTVTNSAASTTSTLTLGEGNGTATFAGTLQNGAGTLALTKTGTGTLTLSGASTFTGAVFAFGGSLEISGGGSLSNAATSGLEGGSIKVSGAGSSWTNTQDIFIGRNGAGTLTIEQGGVVNNTFSLVGRPGGNGSIYVSGAGSQWNNSQGLVLGLDGGTGLLEVSGGGVVSASEVTLAAQSGSTGTLSLLGGTLTAGQISEGAGNGAVTFNGGTLRLSGNQANLFSGFETGDVTLAGSGGTIDTQGFSVGTGLALIGTGSLTKTGSGTLTLSGANTYTGGTTLSAGTLALGSAGALGTTGTLSFAGGTLQFSAANTTDYSARFSNADSQSYALDTNGQNVTLASSLTSSGGSLTKSGTGSLRIDGNNTYSGATTLNGGELILGYGSLYAGGTTSGSIVVNNGATLTFARSHVFGDQNANIATSITINPGGRVTNSSSAYFNTLGALNLNGGELQAAASGSFYSAFLLKGTVTVGGSTPSSITRGATGNPVIELGRAEGFGDNATIFDVADVTQSAAVDLTISTLLANSLIGFSFAPNGITSSLVKTGEGTLYLTLSPLYTGVTKLTAGTLAVGSGSIGNSSSIIFNGGTLQLAASPLADPSSQFSNAAGQLYRIDTNGYSLQLGGGLTSSGGSLTKLGAGTLTLSGTNTYTGGTTVSAGTLQLGNSGTVLADTGRVTVNGGTFALGTANETIGSLAGSGGVVELFNGSGRTLTVGGDNSSSTFSGIIQGSGGGLIKTGSGTLTLAGTNTYTGGTSVSAGTLQLGNSGTVLADTGRVTVDNATFALGAANETIGSLAGTGGTLELFNGSGRTLTVGGDNTSSTYAGTIQGANGALVKTGSGSLTLSGTNTYTGGTTLSAGTLQLANSGSVLADTGRVTVNGGTFALGAANETIGSLAGSGGVVELFNGSGRTLTVGGDNSHSTFSGIIQGSGGGLIKTGSGTLTLAGTNTFTGRTTVSSGFLQIGDGGTTGSIAGDVTNDAGLSFNRSNALLYSGAISGTGSLTKTGSGTLILSGANTYTGGTIVSAGGLQIGNGGTTGSIAGNVISDTVVSFNRSDIFTYSGVISGSGSVTQTGPSTLFLTGANTYTGGTTVSAGILAVGNGGTIGSITGDVVNNSSLFFYRSDALIYNGVISGSGSVTQTGSGTLTLTGANTYTGGTTLSGTLALGSTGALGGTGAISFNGGTLQFSAANTTDYSNRFSTAANQQYRFDTNNQNVTLAAALTSSGGSLSKTGAGTLTLSGTNTYTGTTTLSAGTLQLGNSGTVLADTGLVTINGGIFALGAANETIGALNGTGGVIELFNGSGRTLTVGNTFFSSSYSGIIQGSGGSLIKIGFYSLYLDGTNTYTGGTTVSGGTLQLGGTGTVLADTGRVTVNGGTFAMGAANETIGSLAGSGGTVELNKGIGRELTVGGDDTSTTYAGVIQGAGGALTKIGTGTLTLTGANTYTGLTAISAGTLIGNSASLPGNIFNDSSLVFDQASDGTYAGSIFGSGTLTKSGAGTLTLAGLNSHSGGTTLAAGTLRLGSSGALGMSGTLSFTGGTLQFSAGNTTDYSARFSTAAGQLYRFDTNGQSVTFDSALTSAGGNLTKTGSGTLTLAGANTFTGGTTISQGTLQLGDGGTSGSIAGDIVNNAALAFNRSDALTYSGVISGSGALTKSGAGTLTLSGNNSYSGGTTINAGTLTLGHINGVGSGGVTLAGGTTFDTGSFGFDLNRLSGPGTVTGTGAFTANTPTDLSLASAISGSASLTKSGAGTLTLSGSSTYTGATVIAEGTLRNGAADASTTLLSDATAVSIAAGATFDLGGKTEKVGSLSGAGTLSGGGILALGNAVDTTFSGTLAGTGLSRSNSNLQPDGTLTLTGTTSGSVSLSAFYGGIIVNNSAAVYTNATVNGQTGTLQIWNGTLQGSVSVTGSGSPGSNNGLRIGNGGTTGTLDANVNLGPGYLTFDRSDNLTFSREISGSSSSAIVSKNGAGTLTFTGNNPFYAGGIRLNAGSIQFGDGGTSGMLPGNITSFGNVIFNRSNDLSYGYMISGGSVTKLGAGILTLSNSSNSWDSTFITEGTLKLGAANVVPNTPVSIAAAATLNLNNFTETIGALSGSGGITLGSGWLTVSSTATSTFAGAITGTGSLTKTGTGTLTLSGANTYTGGTTVSAGTLALSADNRLNTTGALTVTGGNIDLLSHAQTVGSFAGTGGNVLNGQLTTTQSTDSTFSGNLISSQLVLSGTGSLTLDGNSDNAYSSAVVNSGTLILAKDSSDGVHSVGGNGGDTALTINSGGTVRIAGTGGQQIYYATNVVNNTGGTLDLNGRNESFNALFGAGTVTNSAAATTSTLTLGEVFGYGTFAGTLQDGAGTLALNNYGPLTLSGTNTYTGGTTLSADILTLGSSGALGSAGTISFAGGRLRFTAANTTDYSGRFNTAANQQYFIDTGGRNVTFASDLISSDGSLTKIGNGTLTLTGINTYTGVSTVNFGTLQIGDGGTTGSIAGDVVLNGSKLTFNRSDAITYGGAISGPGHLIKIGDSTLTLTGTNTYTGETLIYGGTLQVGDGTNASLASSAITNEGSVVFDGGGSTFAGEISGYGSLTKTGTGSVSLTGANTYTGDTAISNGSLVAGSASAFGTGTVRVNAGTLDLGGFAVANTLDVRGGALTGLANYTGTQTLSAAMTYSGTVGGTLLVANSGALNTTDATFTGATTVQSGGHVSGTGSLASLTLNSGATLAPGNSPGTLTAGSTTWEGGANYVWEINDAASPTTTAGTHYDLLSISGTLTIAATSTNKFTVTLASLLANNTSGDVVNFNSSVNSSYTIASASGGVIGFDPNAFVINRTGFTNNLNGGSWNLSSNGNNIALNFAAASAIPEPSTYAMIFGALALGLAAYRKRPRRS